MFSILNFRKTKYVTTSVRMDLPIITAMGFIGEQRSSPKKNNREKDVQIISNIQYTSIPSKKHR